MFYTTTDTKSNFWQKYGYLLLAICAIPLLSFSVPLSAAQFKEDEQTSLAVLGSFINGHDVKVIDNLISKDPMLVNRRIFFGAPPLSLAIYMENTVVAKRLINEWGPDLEMKDDLGLTPLMFASSYAIGDIVLLLLERGALPCARNKQGKTALELVGRYFRWAKSGVDWELKKGRVSALLKAYQASHESAQKEKNQKINRAVSGLCREEKIGKGQRIPSVVVSLVTTYCLAKCPCR